MPNHNSLFRSLRTSSDDVVLTAGRRALEAKQELSCDIFDGLEESNATEAEEFPAATRLCDTEPLSAWGKHQATAHKAKQQPALSPRLRLALTGGAITMVLLLVCFAFLPLHIRALYTPSQTVQQTSTTQSHTTTRGNAAIDKQVIQHDDNSAGRAVVSQQSEQYQQQAQKVATGTSTSGATAEVKPAAVTTSTYSNYVGTARQAALNAGINPDLFVRQIQKESSFNPYAVSPAGAVGIAQFIPSTAYSLGVNPYDPVQSLYGAARFMASLSRQFGGNYAKALAAYNAGPGSVQYAVSRGGGNWLAYLPYETQQYVYSIMG